MCCMEDPMLHVRKWEQRCLYVPYRVFSVHVENEWPEFKCEMQTMPTWHEKIGAGIIHGIQSKKEFNTFRRVIWVDFSIHET